MQTIAQVDINKVNILATTVKTGEELVERLQQELGNKSLMKNIILDLDRIREFVITAKSIDELINLLKMEVNLLEEMKSDGVILLNARWNVGIMRCYMCTINPKISKKYKFSEGIWGDEDEERVKFVTADIQEKLDGSFKFGEMIYTYEFAMNLPYEINTMDGLIAYIQDKIELFNNMKNDGVSLYEIYQSENEYEDHTICLETSNPEVARKYGFDMCIGFTIYIHDLVV